ncbi:MAG: virulence RhuM family protein [Candidatus Symbiothrix sp.]|nr:virulence RhuM family protein [Candidatus Symbiothrix sp.]
MQAIQKSELQQAGQILLYQTGDGQVSVDVVFENETFWMPQKNIAALFDVNIPAVSKHLKNIYDDEELAPDSTVSKMEIVQLEGNRQVNRSIECYNLDAIIAVGYRVNSRKATKFRQWATNTLKEYIIKGFVLNDELLKNGKKFGKDYFDELLERIREIRASERRAYQKIADIFEQCSADYDPTSEETKLFYAFVQNKMHFAVTGQTAAEIIYDRVDSEKPYMGLTTWKSSPHGKILKSDVGIAKNYLNQHEMDVLNRLVTTYIDFAELRALNRKVTTMQNWIDRTDEFLKFAEQPILRSAGNISHEQAIKKAAEEYGKFREKQDKQYISQFDRALDKYLKGK